jgi:MarR family transcriptional regulator, transcriptional regulator for hemolysin
LIDTDTFGFAITDVARMTRSLLEKRIAAAGMGITPGEARALVHIAALDGARQNRIAERLGVEPMTACGYVDRLEQRGLVARFPDPDDRRAKNVMATDSARQLIDNILEIGTALREDALDGLSAAESEAMMAALRKVRRNLGNLLTVENEDVAAK